MRLAKQPKTERKFWEAIEYLEGTAYGMSRDLARGYIEDPTGEVSREITEMYELSEKLVGEACRKYGIVTRKISLVPGKMLYGDWYQKMLDNWIREEYEKIICSACPFSDGLDEMIKTGGDVPCSEWNGVLYRLGVPYLCAMTSHNWTERELTEKIVKKGGRTALERFAKKEEDLRAKANET